MAKVKLSLSECMAAQVNGYICLPESFLCLVLGWQANAEE